MIRQAVFNILGERVSNANILDLFAGSGSFSIEALSRGAKRAVMVDSSKEAEDCMRKNLETTGFESVAEVIRADVFTALKILKKEGARFHIIFLDPPFDYPIKKVREIFSSLSGFLAEKGIAVLRLKRTTSFELPDCLKLIKRKAYGDSEIYFAGNS